jgi:hypothetical protein
MNFFKFNYIFSFWNLVFNTAPLMKNIFNPDFQDFILALNQCEVKYILVGGYAVILHGYSRTTGDMDIWVQPSRENYNRLARAFQAFGMPVFDMTEDKFLAPDFYDVFTFGRPPVCIDIITHIKGLDFEEAAANAQWFEIEETLQVHGLSLHDLIQAKRASARNKDLDDIEHLTGG